MLNSNVDALSFQGKIIRAELSVQEKGKIVRLSQREKSLLDRKTIVYGGNHRFATEISLRANEGIDLGFVPTHENINGVQLGLPGFATRL